MSSIKRINVTLDAELHSKLEEWAKTEERTVPNLLAYLAQSFGRKGGTRSELETGARTDTIL